MVGQLTYYLQVIFIQELKKKIKSKSQRTVKTAKITQYKLMVCLQTESCLGNSGLEYKSTVFNKFNILKTVLNNNI